jgi:heat shock protein HslJ
MRTVVFPLHRRWAVLIPFLCIFLIARGPGFVASAATQAPAGLSPTDLANMTYHVPYTASGTAMLTDGVYSEPAAPGSASMITVTLTQFIAYGVLNGLQAAAVVLRSEAGGSGVFSDLAVVVREEGQPVNLATILLGDRVQINQVAIEAEQVRVDMVQAGPTDPLCCPTQAVSNTYAIQLVQTESRVAPVNPLAGTTWQETVLNDGTSQVPVDASRYTVAFAAVVVEILADCNRASGAYTVEGDRLTIQLGPVTAAFCPPPSLSDVFLRSLGAAALYRVEGDTLFIELSADAGTMRFARATPDPTMTTTNPSRP